ncbi:hypothetical protein J7J18_06705 [bacterium]|nr:hypothetical protein [bacterium]
MWLMLDTPIPHLELLTQFGISHHLVLFDVITQSKKCKRFYKKVAKKGHWLTLAGVSDFDDVLPTLRELKVSEVVLPYVPNDREGTLNVVSQFVKEVRSNSLFGNLSLMGVPQGKNATDFFQCLVSMAENPYISVLGLSKTSVVTGVLPTYSASLRELFGRFAVLAFLCEEFTNSKPVHILELVTPDVEIPFYLRLPFVRSFDTSFPFRHFSPPEPQQVTSNGIVEWLDYTIELESKALRQCLVWVEKYLSLEGIEA